MWRWQIRFYLMVLILPFCRHTNKFWSLLKYPILTSISSCNFVSPFELLVSEIINVVHKMFKKKRFTFFFEIWHKYFFSYFLQMKRKKRRLQQTNLRHSRSTLQSYRQANSNNISINAIKKIGRSCEIGTWKVSSEFFSSEVFVAIVVAIRVDTVELDAIALLLSIFWPLTVCINICFLLPFFYLVVVPYVK